MLRVGCLDERVCSVSTCHRQIGIPLRPCVRFNVLWVRRAGKPTGGKVDRKQLRLQAAATLKRRVEAEERRREAAAEARAERRMRRGPGEAAGGGAKQGGRQVPEGGGDDRRRARQG